MLSFRMDETNFAQGQRNAVRIVTGTGLKVDFDEFSSDASTLGLWHLHNGACEGEGTGLEDESGSHNLTNYGATSIENGYHFVRSESDYMRTTFSGEPARNELTFEFWLRNWGLAQNEIAYIAYYIASVPNTWFWVTASRQAVAANSWIKVLHYRNGVIRGLAAWTSADVASLLDAPEPIHIAGVLNATAGWLRLHVNGIERAADGAVAEGLAAADYTLTLGNAHTLVPARYLTGILDEVRLSSSVRYTSNFTPYRLLASGAYASPTFDAVRTQADWLDLLAEQITPPGTSITWQVRAAD